MARTKDKERVIALRRKGLSYSQIKEKTGISKSTLSSWLADMPLSKKRLAELQRSDQIIEKIRIAKRKTKEKRQKQVYKQVSRDLGAFSKREKIIAGFFLYWAEGGKTTPYAISLSNTDPAMVRAFIAWLRLLGVSKKKMIMKLHLYVDLDQDAETKYWLRETKLNKANLRKPYIKNSKLSDLTYTNRGHGTCNIIVHGRDLAEYVHQGLRHVSGQF